MIEEKAKVAEKIYVKHENKLIFFRKKLVFHWRKISYFSFTYLMYIEISKTCISISVTVYLDKEHQKKAYAETSC